METQKEEQEGIKALLVRYVDKKPEDVNKLAPYFRLRVQKKDKKRASLLFKPGRGEDADLLADALERVLILEGAMLVEE